MSPTELKNCPFCGGYASAEPHLQHKPGCYFVVLAQFKAAPIGDLSMADEVLAAWNRRTQPAEEAQPVADEREAALCEVIAALTKRIQWEYQSHQRTDGETGERYFDNEYAEQMDAAYHAELGALAEVVKLKNAARAALQPTEQGGKS